MQHVGGERPDMDTTETEFVYPMINAFPVVCGREIQQYDQQEWKGSAAMVLYVVTIH